MDEDIKKRLDEQDKKLAEILVSTEKTRKYIFWTLIISVVVVVLPLLGLLFVIPKFLGTLNLGTYGL